MAASHTLLFTAGPDDIDKNGHVNNAVWVSWMERLATAHWLADARPEHIEAWAWVVTRHEIDYRGNIGAGETALGSTEIRDAPTGARFARHIVFTDSEGNEIVRARTIWALVDRRTGRVSRVPEEVAAPFLAAG